MAPHSPATPRVAVASSGLGHVTRGVEAWAANLSAALHDRGADVTLLKGGGVAERPYEVAVPCLRRDDPRTARLLRRLPRGAWRVGFGSKYDVEQTTFAVNLVGELRRRKVDVLHVKDPHVAKLVQLANHLRLVRTRVILAHGTEESDVFLKGIRYVQHLAPWHHQQFRTAGVDRPTWTTIPNFIDTDTFRPGRGDALRAELGIPPDHLVVLTAAAIKRHHKRVDHLIAEFETALRMRPAAAVTLVVAGGREQDTDELVADGTRRLGDRVRFLVRFPRERMPELYRAADVFVLASLFEMMPIAVLEAVASGLPCVVHPHPVLEWMTGAGGVPADMSRAGELAGHLGRLVDDAGWRATVGRRARAHAAQFGKESVVSRIQQYHRFVSSNGRSR